MDKIYYFDSAATTRIHDDVFSAMEPYLKDYYGNASSHYSLGNISKNAIDNAREIIAAGINCSPDEIYFTSGGSEANNWVIKGFKHRFNVITTHIVTTNIEHHSITEALKRRWSNGEDITFTCVPTEKNGVMDPESIANNFKLNTRLCSVQMINNELGTIQPIEAIAAKCYDNNIALHCDAVQALGHIPIDVKKMGINLMSMSGHKCGASKGIGALYISNDYKSQIVPFINGGQQERGMRASTENVAGIVGFGKAVELSLGRLEENTHNVVILADILTTELERIAGVQINVPLEYTDYRHINIRIDGVRSEELMALLDSQNICVSAGSACNSDSDQPSHVLKAIGLTDEQANSSIRISLSGDNTIEEVEYLVSHLKEDIEILRDR